MTLYAGFNPRTGYMGYAYYTVQASPLVTPDAIADPTSMPACNSAIGPAEWPQFSIADNFQPVETMGLSRDAGQVPARRECELSTTIQVCDGSIFPHFIRSRTAPIGDNCGLKRLAIETGVLSDYGADLYDTNMGLDCLPNEVSFEFAESRPVSARCSFMPLAVVPLATAQTGIAFPTNVLMWQHLSGTVGSVDYHSILAGGTLTIRNQVERRGMRKQMGVSGAELSISRTPYALVPGLEKCTLSLRLHDKLPASLLTSADWGPLTLRAAHPTGTVGGRFLQIVIGHSFLSRWARNAASAGTAVEYTAETAPYEVTITAGTVS